MDTPQTAPQASTVAPLDHATETVAVLSVPFAKVTEQDTINAIEAMIAAGKPHYLATGNVDFLLQASKDVELRRILHDADLVVCDSKPIVWISRVLGNALPERVAGSDLTPALLEVAEQKGYSVFFLGGRPDIGERAMENIRKKHPNLANLHYYSPPNQAVLEMDHDAINQRIIDAKPDMLFVSFGCPKQEKWIAMNYQKIGVPMSVGVGATIDFLAGAVSRAPVWMQKIGLEWLYRMCREPKRLFKRYMMGIAFFFIHVPRQILGLATLSRPSGTKSQTTGVPTKRPQPESWHCILLPPRFDATEVSKSPLANVSLPAKPIAIDGHAVEFIDSTGIGELISLCKRLRKCAQPFSLLSPSAPLTKALKLMQVDSLIPAVDNEDEFAELVGKFRDQMTEQQKVSATADSLTVTWQGEVTAATTDGLWTDIQSALTKKESKQTLLVDLSDVTFVDSTGIGLMVKLKKTLAGKGGEARFVSSPENVKNVLEHTKMTRYLLGDHD